MRITGVETSLFAHPLPRQLGDANAPAGFASDAACLVEVKTDEGITGVSIVRHDVRIHASQLVSDVLMGRDPKRVTGLWQSMLDARFEDGAAGVVKYAAAALDTALWDLKAKANDEPLWRTLGACRPKANVHASGRDLPLDDRSLTEWYGTMARSAGCRAGKLKVGADQSADLRRLGLVRRALEQRAIEPALIIDIDEYWSPKQAIRKIREMETQFDLAWVEAPARRWDFLGTKRVSDAIRAAVCGGATLDAPGDFLAHIHHRAFDIVQLDPARIGITGALQLADAAFGFELPTVLCDSPGNVHAHLAGAMPYFMSLEVVHATPPAGVFTTDVRIEDGFAIAGDRPGNGLEIDRAALAQAAIAAMPRMASIRARRRSSAGLYATADAGSGE